MTANVALTDTFDQWRVKCNELIVGTQSDGMANILKTTDTTNSTSNTTGSIITAGGIGVAKCVNIGEDLKVWGDVTTVGDTTISGNLTFGDASTDQVTFSADINSSLIPNANLSFNIGNTTMQWANAWVGHAGITQKTDSGKPALSVTSTDTNVIAVDIDASQIDADVIDIAADAVTTAKVIDITADSLTTGSGIYLDDDSASTSTRKTVEIIQNNAAALAATALQVQSDGGITGMTLDKNFSDATAATVTGLHVDFDRTVPGSGTAAFTDIGINVDVNAAGLGTTTTTGLDIDVVGATSGTHTATGIDIAVSGADTNYALITTGGNVGISTAAPASALHVTGTMQVGVDDTGHDVKFYGDTAGKYFEWDTSEDRVNLVGNLVQTGTYQVSGGGITVGVDGTGYDVKFFGDTAGKYWLWDESADGTVQVGNSQLTGNLTVGVNDVGHDVKFYGAAAGSFLMWNQSENSLLVRGALADAAGSSGTIVLQTAQVSVEDGDILGRIDFQAPDETQGSDGTLVSAAIWAEADATFTASVNNTELVFGTGESEVAAEKMRLTSDGKLGIGIATPASLLDVRGTMQVGVDGTGHDVIFYSDTAGKKMFWDETAYKLIVHGKQQQRFGSAYQTFQHTAWALGS